MTGNDRAGWADGSSATARLGAVSASSAKAEGASSWKSDSGIEKVMGQATVYPATHTRQSQNLAFKSWGVPKPIGYAG